METVTCWWGQRSHSGVKGHLRSNVQFYLQVSKMSNNSAVISPILTKLGWKMYYGDRHMLVGSKVTCRGERSFEVKCSILPASF